MMRKLLSHSELPLYIVVVEVIVFIEKGEEISPHPYGPGEEHEGGPEI